MSREEKKKDKKKKRKGGVGFGASFFFVILFIAAAVFLGYRYVRPLYFEQTRYFDRDEFGFTLPGGFESRRMPLLPRGSGLNISVLVAEGDAEEVMDRVSLSAAGSGWKSKRPSLPQGDFRIVTDALERAASRIGKLTGDVSFFSRNGEYMTMKTVDGGELIYVVVLKGGGATGNE